MRILAVLAVSAALLGCRNSCQRICVHMAKYAEECGLSVSNEQMATCFQEQAGAGSRDDRATCRDFNDPEVIRTEWDCEDLALFFDEEGASDGE